MLTRSVGNTRGQAGCSKFNCLQYLKHMYRLSMNRWSCAGWKILIDQLPSREAVLPASRDRRHHGTGEPFPLSRREFSDKACVCRFVLEIKIADRNEFHY